MPNKSAEKAAKTATGKNVIKRTAFLQINVEIHLNASRKSDKISAMLYILIFSSQQNPVNQPHTAKDTGAAAAYFNNVQANTKSCHKLLSTEKSSAGEISMQ